MCEFLLHFGKRETATPRDDASSMGSCGGKVEKNWKGERKGGAVIGF